MTNMDMPTRIIGKDSHCPMLITSDCPKMPASGVRKYSAMKRNVP